LQSELAMEGPRSKRTSAGAGASAGVGVSASAGCLNAVNIVSSSSDSKDLEGSSSLQFLTVKTVQVYIVAIAEIYYT